MDANVEPRSQEPVLFHLTGRRLGADLQGVAGLRPALLAHYRDLTQLRYDFPLVLVENEAAGTPVRTLSAIVDGLLQRIAPPGIGSERLRRLVLRLEREIRSLAAQGATGLLSELWDAAAERLEPDAQGTLGRSVRVARAALDADGTVLDCDAAMPSRLAAHLWSAVEAQRARAFWERAGGLMIRLADILQADLIRSEAGRRPDRLEAGFGGAHRELFDFEAMSRILPKSSAQEALPQSRRRRIEWALSVLRSQRLFAPPPGQTPPAGAPQPHGFLFATCGEAIAAFRARLPEVVELVKALSIAELEVEAGYVEANHDALFAGFDASALDAEDLASLPSYLVTLSGLDPDGENAGLLEALSSDVPLKVLVNVRELVPASPNGGGLFTSGLPSSQLANMAVGLGGVYVLQSASSNLFQARDRIRSGLVYRGPALFAVYCGAASRDGALPPYLSAAAALQSRAFPTFAYDPAAGAEMASRFSLDDNPQPESAWTTHRLEYADGDLQRITAEVAFTFVDFLATQPDQARHFACVPAAQWSDRMVPAAEWLSEDSRVSSGSVPYIWAVDATNGLHRIVVDEKGMQAARRCADVWRRLQEFGGVHNSHAERLLSREKAAWEETRRRELDSLKAAADLQGSPAAAPSVPVAAPPAPAAVSESAEEPARSRDAAYIETPRCSSCNECIQINDRMFAYDGNKQAYIADLGAGTYAQLVEAAESCQVAIIHPGMPRNRAEPGLDDLIARAEPFR